MGVERVAMTGLIEEIQRDALNPAVSVATILRKVKVAASKLNFERVEDWVECELSGYVGKELPSYRILYGRPQAFNPYRGWIPILMGSDADNQLLSKCEVRQSVSSLEDLISRNESNYVEMPFPSEIVSMLNSEMRVKFGRMANHFAPSQIQDIIDQVRNQLLDWALSLEKAGVRGEGYSFNEAEKTMAKDAGVTFNINSIGTFAGAMGSGNTVGDIFLTASVQTQIQQLVDRIRSALPELESAGVNRSELQHAIDVVAREIESPKPDVGRLKRFLNDAKQTLIGAAGNLTAEGASALIASVLKALGS